MLYRAVQRSTKAHVIHCHYGLLMAAAWLLIGHHSTRAGSEGCTGSFSSVSGHSQGVGAFAYAWQINVDAACSLHHLQPTIIKHLAAGSEVPRSNF